MLFASLCLSHLAFALHSHICFPDMPVAEMSGSAAWRERRAGFPSAPVFYADAAVHVMLNPAAQQVVAPSPLFV